MVQIKETKKNEDIELDFFWFLNIFINFIQYICTSPKGIWPTIKLKCICLALFTKLERTNMMITVSCKKDYDVVNAG